MHTHIHAQSQIGISWHFKPFQIGSIPVNHTKMSRKLSIKDTIWSFLNLFTCSLKEKKKKIWQGAADCFLPFSRQSNYVVLLLLEQCILACVKRWRGRGSQTHMRKCGHVCYFPLRFKVLGQGHWERHLWVSQPWVILGVPVAFEMLCQRIIIIRNQNIKITPMWVWNSIFLTFEGEMFPLQSHHFQCQ